MERLKLDGTVRLPERKDLLFYIVDAAKLRLLRNVLTPDCSQKSSVHEELAMRLVVFAIRVRIRIGCHSVSRLSRSGGISRSSVSRDTRICVIYSIWVWVCHTRSIDGALMGVLLAAQTYYDRRREGIVLAYRAEVRSQMSLIQSSSSTRKYQIYQNLCATGCLSWTDGERNRSEQQRLNGILALCRPQTILSGLLQTFLGSCPGGSVATKCGPTFCEFSVYCECN